MPDAVTSIGHLRLKRLVPSYALDLSKPLTAKNLTNMMTAVAKKENSQTYMKILNDLQDFGFETANEYGGPASVKLSDVEITPRLKAMRDALKRQVYNLAQRKDLDSKTKNKLIVELVKKATPEIDKAVMEELTKGDNSFGLLVGSGAKGKPQQLRQLIFGDLLTVDSKLRDIPYPTFRSYGEGTTPMQYWTASHGGRYGYIQVQKATADAGYFAKQTRGVVHREIITTEDCGKARPLFTDADDENNIGSLLANKVKGKSGKVYPADTILTEDILDDLDGRIPIRSAISCGAAHGICAKCAGVRESGKLPDIGEAVGLNGINAGNEQITQMGLCLHGNTLVRMADGSEQPISSIVPGDLVLACDIEGQTFSTPVVAVHRNGILPMYTYYLTEVSTGDQLKLVCTAEHKVLQTIYIDDSGFLHKEYVIKPLGLDRTEHCCVLAGADGNANSAVTYKHDYAGKFDSYDLEIDTPDHLFVLANNLIVSNSSKHSGGESVSANRVKRGFAAIEQFVNMPENFVGGASIAPVAGKVTSIADAPQGGKTVTIGDSTVHVTAGLEPTVKQGQYVEAGDVISEGMPNISKIAKYKGLGEGRKQFIDGFYNIMFANGSAIPKKQIEPFARAYLDRVEITDPDGVQGWILGDIASYSALEHNWKPREGTLVRSPNKSIGRYLEMPVAHYTIGTKITPAVAKDLSDSGVTEVYSNDKEAPFVPHLTSAKRYVAEDPDWLTALSGEGLMKSFIQHVQRGSDTRKGTTSYYPDLALIGVGQDKPLQLD